MNYIPYQVIHQLFFRKEKRIDDLHVIRKMKGFLNGIPIPDIGNCLSPQVTDQEMQ